MIAGIAAVALVAVWLFTQQPAQTPAPAATLAPANPTQQAAPATPTPAVAAAGRVLESTSVSTLPGQLSAAEFAEEACGDFTCDASERCDTCAKDCGCAGDEYCNRLNGVCYAIEK